MTTAISREAGRYLLILLQHPRPEAKWQGTMAWREGQSRTDNPYPPDSPEFVSWDSGWDGEQRDSE